MILDSEIQRKLLLALIEGSTFKGGALDTFYRLKAAIIEAPLSKVETPSISPDS